MPVDVFVNVFASLDTTRIMVTATYPPCLVTACVVVALIRVNEIISPFALLPTRGLSFCGCGIGGPVSGAPCQKGACGERGRRPPGSDEGAFR